jgi:hypothetical protein
VVGPNEFWLNLHSLAKSYEAEGLTTDERTENIVDQFRQMPRIAQRQVLGELAKVITSLPDLYPLIVAAANESESAKSDGQRTKTA